MAHGTPRLARGAPSPPGLVRRRAAPLLCLAIGGAVLALVLEATLRDGTSPLRSFVSGPPRGLAPPKVRAEAAAVAQVPGAEEALEVGEPEFLALVEDSQVSEVSINKWRDEIRGGGRLMARLTDGRLVVVVEDGEVEDLRNQLVLKGVPVRYPKVDNLSEEEALETAEFSSEGAVAGGFLTALAVGVADSLLEIGGAVVVTGGELGTQSLLEKESVPEVITEDLGILGKDLRFLERAAQKAERLAEADLQAVEGAAASEVSQFEGVLASVGHWFQDVSTGLVKNHAPGVGGLIEDSFMGLLTAVSLYSLYQMAFLKRKSNSWSGLAHTATGAMQIGTVVYAILEERCLRESPGPVWAVFTFAIFMVNNITMWPLLKYFKGPEVQRVLFKLAYSFIISFQGIHAIAWSIKYEWLYWIVMPFWFYSVKKLAESSDNIFALLPEGTVPVPGLQEAAKRRVKGIQNDTPTLVYSILNFAGAVFDNLYMAVYTWRGPAGFWGWSAANIPGINDHLRTGLVKPAFGSLTISVLVFLGTLVYRKKLSTQAALVLNVVLASIGPWLILYYHKLVDWDEPWQPEIMGDWGSLPYIVNHFSDLGALLVGPLALFGFKALTAAAPAVAEGLPGSGAEAVLAEGLPANGAEAFPTAEATVATLSTPPSPPPAA